MTYERLPIIIQGGMGAGVSSWSLARAVSKAGPLGNAAVEIIGRADVERTRTVFEDVCPELCLDACQTPREQLSSQRWLRRSHALQGSPLTGQGFGSNWARTRLGQPQRLEYDNQ